MYLSLPLSLSVSLSLSPISEDSFGCVFETEDSENHRGVRLSKGMRQQIGERDNVCVCEREREKERERKCVCV
jgi:hypothetical protein